MLGCWLSRTGCRLVRTLLPVNLRLARLLLTILHMVGKIEVQITSLDFKKRTVSNVF
jgi:hypothetical protein